MRITAALKYGILKRAIDKAGCTEINSALVLRRAKLAEDFRRLFVSEELEQEIIDLFKLSVSPRFIGLLDVTVRYKTFISLNINGELHNLWFTGYECSNVNCKSISKLTYSSNSHRTLDPDQFVKYQELVSKLQALNKEQACNHEKRENLRVKVNGLLSNITSSKKLFEVWPESVELLPTEVKIESKEIAICTSDLNTIIGLPTK